MSMLKEPGPYRSLHPKAVGSGQSPFKMCVMLAPWVMPTPWVRLIPWTGEGSPGMERPWPLLNRDQQGDSGYLASFLGVFSSYLLCSVFCQPLPGPSSQPSLVP